MQELSIELKEKIDFGLRKDQRSGRDTPGLISLFNAKQTEYGIRQFEPPAIPTALQTAMTSASITVSFPFPQLFKGKTQTFLLTATKLYTVSASWALTQVSTFNPITLAAEAITTGNPWHFADYKDSYVFFNGVCTVFKWKFESLYGDTDKAYVFTTPFINTGVDFAGRVIFGGFTDGVWKDDWLSFWESFDSSHLLSTDFAIADNSVMWTSVAGSEFWWLVRPDVALAGSDNKKVIQMLKSNQFGWKQLNHNVLRILPHGQNCIVYGSDGITLMYPTQVGSAPTFGFKQLHDFGIIGRSAAVQIGIGRHAFVATDGNLWILDSEQGSKAIGYSEFLTSAVSALTVLSYDVAFEKDVYVSDGVEGFVYSKSGGFSEVSKLYTSLIFNVAAKATVGIFEDTSVNTFELITDAINFGTASMKTITSVEIIGTDTTGMTVALDYVGSKTQSFSRTSFFPTNLQGIAYVRANGYDFRVVVRSTDYTAVEIDDIIVKVQYDDKRNIRGLTGSLRGRQNL